MKNPNGYGSVFKLSGNRRRSWCARVTSGWTDDGKQKYKIIGYFVERSEAMIALAKYNDSPYDVDNKNITFSEIYQMWSKEKFPKMSNSTVKGHTTAYNKCSKLYDMKFKQIRKMHMQRAIDENGHLSYQTQSKIKVLCSHLFKFAIENDITDKDYSQFLEIKEMTTTVERLPFSNEEIEKLWNNIDVPYVDTLLIMIYSGMRIGELLKVKHTDIDIENRIIIGGLKTKAGKNRAIPIHHRILPIITELMNKNEEYLLLSVKGKQISYNNYILRIFPPIMKHLQMSHLPHDCRHTTATMLDNAGVSSTTVKKILGHSASDVTERVYTHKTYKQLVEAIDKI